MNKLQRARLKVTLRNTWPFYVVSAVLVAILMNLFFNITHKAPDYKTLTVFVSGEVTNSKKLKNDMLERFKENDLKSFTTISANPNDSVYNAKLTIPGYSSADVLIIPSSKLENLVVSDFALELEESLISSFYQGYALYEKDSVKYGVKINKDIVKDYMTLPSEECYMFLNGNSVNTGEYSPKQIKEHDNALNLVKDWGM